MHSNDFMETPLILPAIVIFLLSAIHFTLHVRVTAKRLRESGWRADRPPWGDVRPKVYGVMIGFFVVLLSTGLLVKPSPLPELAAKAIGIYFYIVGHQILLWGAGIESEWLGNVPSRLSISDPDQTVVLGAKQGTGETEQISGEVASLEEQRLEMEEELSRMKLQLEERLKRMKSTAMEAEGKMKKAKAKETDEGSPML